MSSRYSVVPSILSGGIKETLLFNSDYFTAIGLFAYLVMWTAGAQSLESFPIFVESLSSILPDTTNFFSDGGSS